MTAADYLAAIRAREQAAHAEVVALCNGAKWTMRIPAQPDRDSDLVIEAALADVRRMADALDAVLALTYASDDGTEWEHGEGCDGQSDCARCWSDDIRAAITDALGGGE